MAKIGTRQRKVIRRLLWLVAAGGLLLALLPVWFPWVLTPVLQHYGLAFAKYDRISYTRFALGGVRANWNGTRLAVKRIECVLPAAWVWQQAVGDTNSLPFLSLADGELVIAPALEKTAAGSMKGAGSLAATLNDVVQVASTLERLLPAAELTNCSIRFSSNLVVFPQAMWRAGLVRATVQMPAAAGALELTGQIKPNAPVRLALVWGAYDAEVQGDFTRVKSGWQWEGSAKWLTNQASISAQFAATGWWPLEARLDCAEFRVPAKLIRRSGYEDLTASLAVHTMTNHFDVAVAGVAKPTDEAAVKGVGVAQFSLAVEGDPNAVKLRKLQIQSPGLNADLTSSVGATWGGELLAKPARFHVDVDLSRLPGTDLTGRAEGVIQVTPHGTRNPTAQFRFSAEKIRTAWLEAEQVVAQGEYASTGFQLDELSVTDTNGSKLAVSGRFDFATQSITNGKWTVAGSFLKTYLPGWNYNDLAGSGQLQGPLTNLTHGGEIKITGFQGHGLKPLAAQLKWRGQMLQVDSLEVQLAAGESVFSLAGATDLSLLREGRVAASLKQASLRRRQDERYALEKPCTISFAAGETNVPPGRWELAVDAFEWRGPHRALALAADISWPQRGRMQATLTNFSSGDFADFLTDAIPNLSLPTLDLSVNWSNGPIHSRVAVSGVFTNRANSPLMFRGELATDDTLSVKQLSFENAYTPPLSITGNIPVQVIPGRPDGWLVWDESKPMALTGRGEAPDSANFTLPLPKLGKLQVAKPNLSFQVSGTLAKPSASIRLATPLIMWPSATRNSMQPRIEDLQLGAEIHPNLVRLDGFSAKLDGQLIEAAGEWPLQEGAWEKWWSVKTVPDWTPAHGWLRLERAQVAAFARYLPDVLAPEGWLSTRLELKAGREFSGWLTLTNAATRPLGKLAPVRDIAAQVRLDGLRAVLEEFRGQIGGQPVRANGFVTMPQLGQYDYQVNLRGTNVPLARSLELVLRSDFDLQLRGGSNLPPVLSGSINLRDGLYLQHASALVWSGPKRPQLRPPYFSVTNEPLANWKLDVAISGDRFLRVRTPVLSGVLSANLKLRGLLQAPELTGDLKVNSGRILFPFGTLNLDQGYASFNGNDQQGPDLQISASGRNYRYNVQLQANGPANVADINFSSTPPLASEQILLMLTAGELPQSDYVFSNQARAGRLATFLGSDLVTRYLGNSRGEERLIIRTGESISEEGRLTYSVEYRLTDRWSLIGEYDEFNAFNADLKWKIFTR